MNNTAMQPSIFNIRVPLPERDEVFLMNTLTDAQLVVSPDVAASARPCGGHRRQRIGRPLQRRGDPMRSNCSARTGFSSRIDARSVGDLDQYLRASDQRPIGAAHHGADHAPVQLRVRLLLPGRSRRLQQVRRKNDARDGAVSVGDWIERELDRVQPERLTLMFFGGEPLLNLPVMYYLSERMSRATRERGLPMSITHHHQRSAAHT